MDKNIGRYTPAHPHVGKLVESLTRPFVKAIGATLNFYDNKSRYATLKGQEMRNRLSRGESVYLFGVGPSGHNSTAALVEVSSKDGIVPICNNEEERYTGVRNEDRFPENSIKEILHPSREPWVSILPIFLLSLDPGITWQESPPCFGSLSRRLLPAFIWHGRLPLLK